MWEIMQNLIVFEPYLKKVEYYNRLLRALLDKVLAIEDYSMFYHQGHISSHL